MTSLSLNTVTTKQNKLLYLAVRMDRWPAPEFVSSLVRNVVVASSFLSQNGYALAYSDSIGLQRQTAGNDLVTGFLKISRDPEDLILFLDSDMIFPNGFIEKLIRHNKPVVGGFYAKRLNPGFPLVMDFLELTEKGEPSFVPNLNIDKGQLVKCDATGLGCCLIRKKVFTHLNYPYFTYAPPFEEASEEMSFFWQLREKGISCHVDTSIDCLHLYLQYYGFDMFSRLRDAAQKNKEEKNEQVSQIESVA